MIEDTRHFDFLQHIKSKTNPFVCMLNPILKKSIGNLKGVDKRKQSLRSNLTNDKSLSVNEYKDLYHLRWDVEESYKRQKQWLEIENFSGKTALSVKQDFFAKLVTLNLTAITLSVSQAIVRGKISTRKCQYKVNFAQALSKMKDNIIALLHHTDWQEHLIALIKYCSQTIEVVRKGRTFIQRKSKFKYLCYKGCR